MIPHSPGSVVTLAEIGSEVGVEATVGNVVHILNHSRPRFRLLSFNTVECLPSKLSIFKLLIALVDVLQKLLDQQSDTYMLFNEILILYPCLLSTYVHASYNTPQERATCSSKIRTREVVLERNSISDPNTKLLLRRVVVPKGVNNNRQACWVSLQGLWRWLNF